MDPIADMFTIIRNGYAVQKKTVIVSYSKFKLEVAKLLQESGFIKSFSFRRSKKAGVGRDLDIVLAYKENQIPAVEGIKRISKPSCRIYISYKDIFPSGRRLKILSTPKGVLSDKEAREKKVGGEVIAEVY